MDFYHPAHSLAPQANSPLKEKPSA